MKICPKCGAHNRNIAVRCKSCAEYVLQVKAIPDDQAPPQKGKSYWLYIIIIALFFSLLAGGLALMRSAVKKGAEKAGQDIGEGIKKTLQFPFSKNPAEEKPPVRKHAKKTEKQSENP